LILCSNCSVAKFKNKSEGRTCLHCSEALKNPYYMHHEAWKGLGGTVVRLE